MTNPHPITRRVLGIASIVTALLGRELQAQTMPSPSAGPKNGPSKANVRLTVNGQAHDLALDPRTSLLDALRDHLGLAGTKKGCDHGQCGACPLTVRRTLDFDGPFLGPAEGARMVCACSSRPSTAVTMEAMPSTRRVMG